MPRLIKKAKKRLKRTADINTAEEEDLDEENEFSCECNMNGNLAEDEVDGNGVKTEDINDKKPNENETIEDGDNSYDEDSDAYIEPNGLSDVERRKVTVDQEIDDSNESDDEMSDEDEDDDEEEEVVLRRDAEDKHQPITYSASTPIRKRRDVTSDGILIHANGCHDGLGHTTSLPIKIQNEDYSEHSKKVSPLQVDYFYKLVYLRFSLN